MWTLSFITKNEKSIINILANKHNISFFGYPLNVEEKKDFVLVTFYGWTNASITKTEQFYKDLSDFEDVVDVEYYEQAIILCIKQPKEAESFYSRKIIYLKPILINNDFTQEYVLGSWNRDFLSKILQTKIKNVDIKLRKIEQKPIQNIGLFSPINMTQKQQNAFQLAKQEGYYEFPKRNTNLNALAKKSDVSMATLQAHLRKAEQKILNNYNQLNNN